MAAYTVHPLKTSGQLVVVLQYPGTDTGETRLVAPLYPADPALEMEIVTPRVDVGGEGYLVAMHLLASVRQRDLGPSMASLETSEYALGGAINRLFFGI